MTNSYTVIGMDAVRLLAINGPAAGREFPDTGDALFVLADDYSGFYRYEIGSDDGERVYLCHGLEPLDAVIRDRQPVGGWRI